MKTINFFRILTLITVAALCLCQIPAQAESLWEITQLTNTPYSNGGQKISDSNVVWDGDSDIWLCNAELNNPISISLGGFQNHSPQISGSAVTWQAFDLTTSDNEIFFFDGFESFLVSDNRSKDNSFPKLSGNYVVWQAKELSGTDYEIFIWQNGPIAMLTNNDYDDRYPEISGPFVVWQAWDEQDSEDEIFFWDGTIPMTIQITDNTTEDYDPRIYDCHVVWQGLDEDSDYEIFFWDESESDLVQKITNNLWEDRGAQISDSYIVWQGKADDADYEIFFVDLAELHNTGQPLVHQLTNNIYDDQFPMVSGSNVVWWAPDAGSDFEIFFADLNNTDPNNEIIIEKITDNTLHDFFPEISGDNVTWKQMDASYISQIFFAKKLVLTKIEVSPPSYNFGNVLIDEEEITTITISNVSPDTVNLEYIDLQQDSIADFSVESAPKKFPVPLVPGGSLPIEIEFAPSITGPALAILEIGTDVSGEEIIDVPLNGYGVAFPDIVVLPLTYDFNEVYVGTSAETTVDIINMGNLLLEIDSIDFHPDSNSDFSIVSAPNLPATLTSFGGKQDTSIEIAYTPSQIGPASAILEIRSNDPDESLVQVTLSALAVAPDIEVVPTAYDFNDVVVDTNQTTTVTISNQGQADLTISEVSLQLRKRSDFYIETELNLPMDLAYGEFIDIDVVFIPSSVGLSTDILEIYSNDPVDNIVQVQLSGTGISP